MDRKTENDLDQKKTKVMIFNFTNKYRFTTRLELNEVNLEVVEKAKLLGVIISNDLKWDENTSNIVKGQMPDLNYCEE